MQQEKRDIYLDHAATTPAAPQVIEAVAASMRSYAANPSAAYSEAGKARKELRLAKETLSQAIGCDRNELFFTSGGTEANNWVFHAHRGQHVVLSAIEHSSVIQAAEKNGCRCTLITPDRYGVIQPEAVARAIQPDTKLISVQAANNETGVIQPTEQIWAVAKQHRILFHCDAVQAFGHIPTDVKRIGCDLLSVSAHKLYGPRGIGFLYIRSGIALPAMLHGGGQENGRRSGTENIPAISGFRIAVDLALKDMHLREMREKLLLEQFISRLFAAVPACRLLGESALRVPGICAIRIPGLPAEYAISKLDMQGIMVSGGAACASHSAAPSHVYTAMGLTPEEAACVLRISPGRATTEEDMLTACDALIGICKER